MNELIDARDHHVFPGALDREDLNVAERAVVKVVNASYGDFRDAEAAESWADGIADALEAAAMPST